MSAAPNFKPHIPFRVQILQGPHAGQSFAFEKVSIDIGRGNENDLVLSSDLRVSRRHAQIHWDGEDLHIVNVSKKSFMVVNGDPVSAAKLEPGSIVFIGESEFRVDFKKPVENNAGAEPKTKINFTESPSPLVVQMPPHQSPRPVILQPSVGVTPPPPVGLMGGAAGPQVNYGANLPGNMGRPAPRSRSRRRVNNSGSKSRFYIIVIVIGLFFAWLMTSNSPKKKELTFRSTEQIQKDIELSQEELKEFEARKERLDNIQYRRAQENYIRGFRDYKQGNYGRARESFQVVLNLDPENELAKRYYQLARIKFDEMVKFHMLQGNRYREKKNWRMCKASYFNVMTMISNNQDPVYKEARQYYNECSLAQEGRY